MPEFKYTIHSGDFKSNPNLSYLFDPKHRDRPEKHRSESYNLMLLPGDNTADDKPHGSFSMDLVRYIFTGVSVSVNGTILKITQKALRAEENKIKVDNKATVDKAETHELKETGFTKILRKHLSDKSVDTLILLWNQELERTLLDPFHGQVIGDDYALLPALSYSKRSLDFIEQGSDLYCFATAQIEYKATCNAKIFPIPGKIRAIFIATEKAFKLERYETTNHLLPQLVQGKSLNDLYNEAVTDLELTLNKAEADPPTCCVQEARNLLEAFKQHFCKGDPLVTYILQIANYALSKDPVVGLKMLEGAVDEICDVFDIKTSLVGKVGLVDKVGHAVLDFFKALTNFVKQLLCGLRHDPQYKQEIALKKEFKQRKKYVISLIMSFKKALVEQNAMLTNSLNNRDKNKPNGTDTKINTPDKRLLSRHYGTIFGYNDSKQSQTQHSCVSTGVTKPGMIPS